MARIPVPAGRCSPVITWKCLRASLCPQALSQGQGQQLTVGRPSLRCPGCHLLLLLKLCSSESGGHRGGLCGCCGLGAHTCLQGLICGHVSGPNQVTLLYPWPSPLTSQFQEVLGKKSHWRPEVARSLALVFVCWEKGCVTWNPTSLRAHRRELYILSTSAGLSFAQDVDTGPRPYRGGWFSRSWSPALKGNL